MSSPSPMPAVNEKEGEDKDSLFSSEESEGRSNNHHLKSSVIKIYRKVQKLVNEIFCL